MRNRWQRKGRIAFRLIAVGAAALFGGVATIPTLITDNKKSSAPIASSSRELVVQPSKESQKPLASLKSSASLESFTSLESFESLELPASSPPQLPAPSASPSDIAPPEAQPSAAKQGVEHLRIFYATDRQLYHANNPHLWITAIAPSVLCILITSVLIAGCFAGKRRWAWGLGSCVGLVISFILVGQSIIKVGQLVRLAKEGSLWFASGRFDSSGGYPLHLGTSDVTLPPIHFAGKTEQPSVFSFEFEEREDRHIMVHRIESLDSDVFFTKLSDRISASSDRSALVYVHGFNVHFDEALRRTAQISKDIGFTGAPILYSWPSHGNLLQYRRDESNVEWSVAHLERFLADVHRLTGVNKLHVIAHSMGNRALVGALQLLQLRYPEKQPMLAQVILAAPDLDADEFRDRYVDAVKACATRATLYSSATDRALLASVQLNGYRRLGLTSSLQPTVAGVDLVDVTPVDTSMLGHSYYGSHPLMIRELMSLVHKGIGPEERIWLTTMSDRRDPPLWHFIPELATQAAVAY